MSRYVDIENVKLKGISVFDQNLEVLIPLSDVRKSLQMTPTADVREVKHGKWIYKGHHEMMGHAFECSVCERWIFTDSTEHIVEEYPYCHCGAKMDLEENEK